MFTISNLPTLNASLNGIAAVLLFIGWRCIKAGRRDLHNKFMLSAFVCSIVFLSSYLTYHFNVEIITRYTGTGILRGIYFFILFTHIPLATLIVPFVLAAVWFGLKGKFKRHTKITRWLYPVWMYVSVTGVLIYVMLYV